jgi:hypothetical protein
MNQEGGQKLCTERKAAAVRPTDLTPPSTLLAATPSAGARFTSCAGSQCNNLQHCLPRVIETECSLREKAEENCLHGVRDFVCCAVNHHQRPIPRLCIDSFKTVNWRLKKNHHNICLDYIVFCGCFCEYLWKKNAWLTKVKFHLK